MVTKKSFPKKLYVWIDGDGGEEYMIAESTPEQCASLSEDKLVGIYELDKVAKVLTSVILGPT
jgi:hypothetical protein